MNKLTNLAWYNKLMAAGVLLIVVLNPLSLILLSSGIDLAVAFIGDLLQAGFEFGAEYAIYPMGIGAVALLVGFGASLGANSKANSKKLKTMKKKPTQKAGEYLEV